MNTKAQQKTLIVLSSVAAALVLLFICSQCTFKKSAAKNISSALLNEKYKDEVERIIISCPDEIVTLTNADSFWTGVNSALPGLVWPANAQTVGNLITASINITKMYIKSDKKSSWHSLSVTDSDSIKLSFIGKDGQTVSQLYFGKTNALTGRIAVRSGAKVTVYEMDDSIATYLTAQTSFWADPYVYPRAVTGMSDSQSQTMLRHGQIVYAPETLTQAPVKVITKEFENSAVSTISIYSLDKDAASDYLVIPSFTPSPASTPTERQAISSCNYAYTISAWTEQKLISE